MKRYHLLVIILGSILWSITPIPTQANVGDTSTWLSQTYWGDGQDRLKAYLDFPSDITVDAGGNFFIADTYNNVIRKIDPTGLVSTAFGTGAYGARKKMLAFPQGVAVDANGDLYVADTNNNAIKKIHNGVSTILASGLNKPEGVAVLNNTVYFLDTGNNALKSVPSSGGTVKLITRALNKPEKLWLQGNMAYIANTGSNQIMQVNLTTGELKVVAGTGQSGNPTGSCTTAALGNVSGITGDGKHTLYITSTIGGNLDVTYMIEAINLMTCMVSNIVTDFGGAINAPAGLTYYAGQLYIADTGNGVILHFTTVDHGYVYAVSDAIRYAGVSRFQSDHSNGLVGRPTAMIQFGDLIYFIENNQVNVVNVQTKTIQLIVGSIRDNYIDNYSSGARFSSPVSLAINQAGTLLYVSDRWNHRIRKIDLRTNSVSTLTGTGFSNGNGDQANGYAEGKPCSDAAGGAGCAYFNQPAGMVISPDDNTLYVADAGNHVIRSVDTTTGETQLVAGSPKQSGLVDGVGNKAKFNVPWGLALNAAGTKLYVADRNNHAIRVINLKTRKVKTLAGNGQAGYHNGTFAQTQFYLPISVALKADQLFVTDAGNERIRQLNLTQKTSQLLSGSGSIGWRNGSAKSVHWYDPAGLLVLDNQLLVADNRNDQIRAVSLQ